MRVVQQEAYGDIRFEICQLGDFGRVEADSTDVDVDADVATDVDAASQDMSEDADGDLL